MTPFAQFADDPESPQGRMIFIPFRSFVSGGGMRPTPAVLSPLLPRGWCRRSRRLHLVDRGIIAVEGVHADEAALLLVRRRAEPDSPGGFGLRIEGTDEDFPAF